MPYLPALTFFRSFDALLQRVEPQWWGAVVTDARYPHLYDVNYARVETSDPHLTLEEVERSLRPRLYQAGARHLHTVLFDPDAASPLVRAATERGDRIHWDVAMEFEGDPPAEPVTHRVGKVAEPDGRFWQAHRRALRELGMDEGPALDELGRLAREVQAPNGCSWFRVDVDGDIAGMAALQLHGGTGYVDNVVTFPPFRRRGVAAALVAAAVREAMEAVTAKVFLLADEPGPIRLYQSLGFVEAGRLASTLAPV
jgi:ribosomal protein S18 acetylase RimI-like enzyme